MSMTEQQANQIIELLTQQITLLQAILSASIANCPSSLTSIHPYISEAERKNHMSHARNTSDKGRTHSAHSKLSSDQRPGIHLARSLTPNSGSVILSGASSQPILSSHHVCSFISTNGEVSADDKRTFTPVHQHR